MYQPFMKSLEDNTFWCRVIVQRVICLKTGILMRQYQEASSLAMQTVHLEVSRILSNIRIEENVVVMGLIEVFTFKDIIEYQRNAQ